MPTEYKIIYLFENPDLIIIKLKLAESPSMANSWDAFHWLYFDKLSGSLVKLWFHTSDSSTEIEERYFEQGYLKFSKTEATFIEKFNSSQHKLVNYCARAVSTEVQALIAEYLRIPQGSSESHTKSAYFFCTVFSRQLFLAGIVGRWK